MKLITSLQNSEQVIMAGRQMLEFKSTEAYKDLNACLLLAMKRFENLNASLKPGYDKEAALYNAGQHAMCRTVTKWFQDIIDNGNEADEMERGIDVSGDN